MTDYLVWMLMGTIVVPQCRFITVESGIVHSV
jgi:hypothetical protein